MCFCFNYYNSSQPMGGSVTSLLEMCIKTVVVVFNVYWSKEHLFKFNVL